MNKISAPTPLLDYTLRYNMLKDITEATKKNDIRIDDNREKDKILKIQSDKRLDQHRLFLESIQEVNRYESLKLTREYQEYQYLYSLGTKVDKYI
jgi:hypothetical protein